MVTPLSNSLRRKLEQSTISDVALLYNEEFLVGDAGEIDHTVCWFLEGEDADPDVSIEISVYKITDRRDGYVYWNTRRILVPRSKLASELHLGRLSLKELIKKRQLSSDEGKSIQIEIEGVEKECQEELERIRKKCLEETHEKSVVYEEELKVYGKEITADEEYCADRIEKIRIQMEQDIAEEKRRMEASRADIENKVVNEINEAQEQYNESVTNTKGFKGFTHFELPVVMISCALMSVVALILRFTYIVPLEALVYKLSALAPPSSLFLVVPAICLLVGVVVGGVVGRIVRLVRSRKVSAPLKQLKQRLANDLAVLSKDYEKTIEQLKEVADKAGNEYKVQIDFFNSRKAKIRENRDAVAAEVRSGFDYESNTIRKVADKKIKLLQGKIKTNLKIELKPESEKDSFPPYYNARSLGYKEGLKPAEYEL